MNQIHESLNAVLPEIIAMREDIYCHAELGFKEFETRKKATAKLEEGGVAYQDAA